MGFPLRCSFGTPSAVAASARLPRSFRSLHIDHQWACTSEHEHEFLLLVSWVDVTVYEARRHAEEAAGLDLHALTSIPAELEACTTLHQVPEYLAFAMVVPASRCQAIPSDPNLQRTVALESKFPPDAWIPRRRCQAVTRKRDDPLGVVHGLLMPSVRSRGPSSASRIARDYRTQSGLRAMQCERCNA